ncbi:MAG: hypothetical protein CFE38_17105 [Comamonadaceae bacterium PBBC1]|nr:MAG: hypothetical protein CFE38_17105 [Comamonadaceae bacterium PBBC1]
MNQATHSRVASSSAALVFQGATGVGKTWLACAFGQQACRLKMPVLFYRANDLYGAISESLLDGSLPALKLSLSKPSLLILDDLGLGEMNQHASQFLLDVIDRRMRTGSLLITTQYPTDQWHGFFPALMATQIPPLMATSNSPT